MGRSCHASVAFVFLFYLLNTAAVNSLTVCHPCRPILSAQTGALLKKEKTKRTQNFFFTPSKWSARCLSLRYFLWLKAFSSYRSCPFFRGTAAVAHCVIVKTTHLRCWLQLWWAQACAQMLCRQGGGGKKVVMLSQCKITQQAFLPTVAPWGDVISKQSINPK